MPKKRNYTKAILVIATAAIILLSLFTLPSGTSNDILTAQKDGTELLPNPTLANNCSGWHFGAWRFVSSSWAPSTWTFEDGRVTMEMATGYDRSFYCTMIERPDLDVPIRDLQHDYVVTWRGSMNSGEAKATGALGMGVNFFLDAIKDGEPVETLELYIFFFQGGFYTIPVGSYKDYGYRGSYWFEKIAEGPNDETWRFFYFHPLQLDFGKTETISFSLTKCLETVRQNAGETYLTADRFQLTRIMSVMEMVMAEGSFTTEHLSLKLVG